ncbi:MAG: hemerythrin family protein [Deltaproteobacteria bacterium]|nr:hemerythrin family protein [Deltaproteobacteria bacterium]
MNKLFEWSDDYCVGEKTIDSQHKYLFEKGNEISSISKDNVKRHIMDLYTYVAKHFTYEEKHMKSIGFPYVAEHARIHESIIEDLAKKSEAFDPTWENIIDFQVFILTWISDHIMIEDKKYFDYSKKLKR